MPLSASASPDSSGSFSSSTSTNGVEMDTSGLNAADPWWLLAQGTHVVIRMDEKSLLDYVMQDLASNDEPLYTEIHLSDNGFKYSVKLDVSHLRSVAGNHLPEVTIIGEASVSQCGAKNNAAWKALKYLHEKHLLKVLDFSSRVADRLDSYKTYEFVVDGMRSLEKIFSQWELASYNCQNFTVSLEGKQWDHVVGGQLTDKGHVFALPGNSLRCALVNLDERTAEIRASLHEIQADICRYERDLALKGQMALSKVAFHIVDLSAKEMLSYVMKYLELDDPEYSTTRGPDAHVRSEVKLNFPEMDMYCYGGPINISGIGSSYVEAKEQASLEALLFIEKEFPIKIVDCNYSKRKKATKEHTSLVYMLTKILQLCDDLRMMWGQLSNEISGHQALLGVDPRSFFTGPSAQGQIEAFEFCSTGLSEVAKYSANCHDACANDFEMMVKLTWHHLVLKISMHK